MPRLPSALFALALLPALALPAEAKGPTLAGKDTPLKPIVTGMKNPESVCIGPDGRTYLTSMGEFDKDGDGAVLVIDKGKAVVHVDGLDDPKGILRVGDSLFVADRTRVRRIDRKGKMTTHVEAKDFPRKPTDLNDLEADPLGNLYVTDSAGNLNAGGAIYRIDRNRKVTFLLDGDKDTGVKAPNGLFMSSEYHLFVLDFGSGELSRVDLAGGKRTKLAEGFGGGDGITRDHFGRLYLSDWKGGKVFVIPRPGDKPVLLASGFESAADCCLAPDGKSILVPDMKAGALYSLPCGVPGAAVDESELPVKVELAFPEIKWADWKGLSDKGQVIPHRPIVLTHAGDGSNRVFLATQHGVIHVFPDDPKAKDGKVFLDIQDRVIYKDSEDEEGFLGMAFPTDYKKSGVFYAYYTPKVDKRLKGEKLVNVVSRFRVSKDDPNKADPKSEEILLRLPKPFWNHNGGTIEFGKDGMLYIAIGDGGLANDPFGHAQNMNSLLGKILRIDVSKKDDGLAYAIPKDNPFAGKVKSRGEIWATGLRNVWRMSFDRKTGDLWAADVGQNLWEEINLITKGGNYGWNPREGLHPFGQKGVEPNSGMVEPIWEYHHNIGKSITGGHVYRGAKVKTLDGLYLYADYVSGTIWGLRYDEKQKRVTENRVLRKSGFPVFSFGEDEKGEVYLLTKTSDGRGVFRFAEK